MYNFSDWRLTFGKKKKRTGGGKKNRRQEESRSVYTEDGNSQEIREKRILERVCVNDSHKYESILSNFNPTVKLLK